MRIKTLSMALEFHKDTKTSSFVYEIFRQTIDEKYSVVYSHSYFQRQCFNACFTHSELARQFKESALVAMCYKNQNKQCFEFNLLNHPNRNAI